jgi:hypothetical protein
MDVVARTQVRITRWRERFENRLARGQGATLSDTAPISDARASSDGNVCLGGRRSDIVPLANFEQSLRPEPKAK